MLRIRLLASVLLLACATDLYAQADGPVYVAYFWRAKPGMIDQYNDYITGTAEKIDEDARKAGVFEEVVTVTPSQMGTSAAITEWTHLRIFKLKNRAAAEALGKGLDAGHPSRRPRRESTNTQQRTIRDAPRFRAPGNLDNTSNDGGIMTSTRTSS